MVERIRPSNYVSVLSMLPTWINLSVSCLDQGCSNVLIQV